MNIPFRDAELELDRFAEVAGFFAGALALEDVPRFEVALIPVALFFADPGFDDAPLPTALFLLADDLVPFAADLLPVDELRVDDLPDERAADRDEVAAPLDFDVAPRDDASGLAAVALFFLAAWLFAPTERDDDDLLVDAALREGPLFLAPLFVDDDDRDLELFDELAFDDERALLLASLFPVDELFVGIKFPPQ